MMPHHVAPTDVSDAKRGASPLEELPPVVGWTTVSTTFCTEYVERAGFKCVCLCFWNRFRSGSAVGRGPSRALLIAGPHLSATALPGDHCPWRWHFAAWRLLSYSPCLCLPHDDCVSGGSTVRQTRVCTMEGTRSATTLKYSYRSREMRELRLPDPSHLTFD